MKAYIIPLLVFAISLGLTVLGTKLLIPWLAKKRASQVILQIGPSWHQAKEGTPTMGGIIFLAISALLLVPLFVFVFQEIGRARSGMFALVLLFALGNGAVGIVDDLTKLSKKANKGLAPWQKLALQSVLAGGFVFLYASQNNFSTELKVPFSNFTLSLGLLYYPFLFMFLIWFVNCANLSDGIDGLATSVGGWIGIFLIACGGLLNLVEVSLLGSLLAGCGFGFLVYNKNPAKIFMGDTGSLFFGALSAASACLTGMPLIFFLVGGIYLWEGLSVCIQVVWYKLSHGKRIFKMAPFHHHMEKSGWSERQIVLLFSLVTIFLSLLAVMGVSI